jgi:glutamine cyclotransferase
MLRQIFLFGMILGLVLASSCDNGPSNSGSTKLKIPKSTKIPTLHYSVDDKLPHSTNSFTEGFLVHNGILFESTGSPENLPSTVSVYGSVSPENGEIDVHNQLEKSFFGEGISILNGKVYQLTYQSKTGFVYDLESKKLLRKFTIPTREGWGMTTDGESLLMTDGTSSIHFLNPETLEKIGTLKVFENGRPVNYLNEIEYVDGYIYANIYTTDWVVKIEENSGKVVAKLDLTDLKLEEDKLGSQALETNGIAYNPETKKFYVTGKMWKNIYVLSVFE